MRATQTVQEALESLRAALEAEAVPRVLERVRESLFGSSGRNGHAQAPHPAKRPYRRSKSGRARQIAAVKAYWRKRRIMGVKAKAK